MGGGGIVVTAVLLESPDRATFMSLGHILLALMFGYAGAVFSVLFYGKRRNVGNRCSDEADERKPE